MNFHPDAEFLTQVKKAGADATVVAALIGAKVTAAAYTQAEKELLGQLASAAVLMRGKHYDEAAAQLSEALKASFAGPETGFVMGELLRQKGEVGDVRSLRSLGQAGEVAALLAPGDGTHGKAGWSE